MKKNIFTILLAISLLTFVGCASKSTKEDLESSKSVSSKVDDAVKASKSALTQVSDAIDAQSQ